MVIPLLTTWLAFPKTNMFQTSNSSPIRTTELKLYQCGFTKVPFHCILMSKAPALSSPKRKWESARAKAHLKSKGGRERLHCSRSNLLGQSSQASAEHKKGESMPEATSTLQQKMVAICPEPGPCGLATVITEKKKSTPFFKEDSVDTVCDKTCLAILSVSKHVQRKTQPWIFLQHHLLADPKQEQYTKSLVCSRLKAHLTQIYTQNWDLKINREAKNDNMF